MSDGLFRALAGGFQGASKSLDTLTQLRLQIQAMKDAQDAQERSFGLREREISGEEAYRAEALDMQRTEQENALVDQEVEDIISGMGSMNVAILDPSDLRGRVRARIKAMRAQAAAPPMQDLQRDIGGVMQRGADAARTTTDVQDYTQELSESAVAARKQIGDEPGATAPVNVRGRTVGAAYTKPSSASRQSITSNRTDSKDRIIVAAINAMSRYDGVRATQYWTTARKWADILSEDRWGMATPEEKRTAIRQAQREMQMAAQNSPMPSEFHNLLRGIIMGETNFDIEEIKPESQATPPTPGVRPGDRRGTQLNPPTGGVGTSAIRDRLKGRFGRRQ